MHRELCLTGLTYYFDVNFLGDPSSAAAQLRGAREAGWIRLRRTDTVDTELAEDRNADRRAQLEEESGQYTESLGPWVLDHSRLGHMVVSGVDDGTRIDRVLAIMKPGLASGASARPNDIRDAMHLATAIRYAGTGFITRDSNMLKRSGTFAQTFNGFVVADAETVLRRVDREIRNTIARNERNGIDPKALPGWTL